MGMSAWFTVLTKLLLISIFLTEIKAKEDVCFMIYQVADNDLEAFIRQDNYELTEANFVTQTSVTTWVYFDHRNLYAGTGISEPLKNVYNSDGTNISGEKVEESQYLRWDHKLGKMVVDRTLEGEKNSDDPKTMSDFLITALTDCVNKGAAEYVMVFASHGGGFYGFGGDENQRRMSQSNSNIVETLTFALKTVKGAPSKYDVIGFDSCLMQALGAADDYSSITKYYLASEAVEPGHGWSYNSLTNADSALDLAKDILTNFLEQKQGHEFHQTPKTLAIIDSTKFLMFLASWNTLSAEMENLITNEDPSFLTHLNRARDDALSFLSITGNEHTTKPSSADVGSILQKIKDFCMPEVDSVLHNNLADTLEAYDNMFVMRGKGEGTQNATGMHIFWPTRQEYSNQNSLISFLVESEAYSTIHAPNWNSFLEVYYASTTPPIRNVSVCTSETMASGNPDDGKLLINPSVSSTVLENGDNYIKIETEIAREVDAVVVEYGINLSPLFNGRRRLNHVHITTNKRHDETPVTSTVTRRSIPHRYNMSHHHVIKSKQRHLVDDNIFILLGGDLSGSYSQSKFDTVWDGKFFSIGDGAGNIVHTYAYDKGNGGKYIPVVFFPSDTPITQEELKKMHAESDAVDFGGKNGYITFSLTNAQDGVVSDGLSLFTSDDSSSSYRETLPSSGGQIVPIIYVDARIDGRSINVLVGGMDATIIPWINDTEVSIHIDSVDYMLSKYEVDTVTISIWAFDDDDVSGNYDSASFFLSTTGGVLGGVPPKVTDSSAARLLSFFTSTTSMTLCMVLFVS